MIRLLLIALTLFISVVPLARAAADAVLTNKQYWQVMGDFPLTKTAAGGVEACGKWISNYHPDWRLDPTMATQPSPTAGPYNQHLCRTQAPNGSGGWSPVYSWTAIILGCPADKPFFNRMLNVCQASEAPPAPDPCADSNPMVRKYSYGSAVPPYEMPKSFAGCTIVVDEVIVCRKETIGGVTSTYCMMEIHRTGTKSDATETPKAPSSGDNVGTDNTTNPKTEMPPTAEPQGKCPAGSVQGGIDSSGIPICIGTGTNPPSEPQPKPSTQTTNTETTPDGGTKTTITTTYTNADGSTTTNTTITVKAPDGTTTTSGGTTVGVKPDGTQGTNDKPEDDKYDLCKQNPMLSVCRNSSVSGSCGTITCTGDAIQCATLRAAAAMECKQRQNQDEVAALPATTLGNAIAAGADPMKAQVDAALAGTTVDLSSPNLDQNGFIGGGSCFPNKTMHFGSQAITVDFSSVCEDIHPLRYAVLAVSLIMAYLIVSKSILSA